MEPNAFVVTPQQWAEMKAEMKEEILRDMKNQQQPSGSRYALTAEIKALIHPIFGDDSKVQNAYSTIARTVFDVRHQTFFYGERLTQATEMLTEITEVIKRYFPQEQSED